MRTTNHAVKRIAQRTAYSKKAAAALAGEAREKGLPAKHFKGAFRKYLDGLGIKWRTTPIVYKHSIFIFDRNVLVTVLPVAQRFHKYIQEGQQ